MWTRGLLQLQRLLSQAEVVTSPAALISCVRCEAAWNQATTGGTRVRHHSSEKPMIKQMFNAPSTSDGQAANELHTLVQEEEEEKMKHLPSQSPAVQSDTLFQGLDGEFPCLLKGKLQGPEPVYDKVMRGFKTYRSDQPFHFRLNRGVIPSVEVAYETWGTLNRRRDNAVLIATGMSASSHARSHEDNPSPGWWEKFIGPGCAIDTNKYFVICTNHIGGCYGSTGPSSFNPLTGERYATTFPMVTVEDIVESQMALLDYLGIDKLHAHVGASMGGMVSLAAGCLYPHRLGRMVSISSTAQTPPSAIALRFLQRRCIMADPHWNTGCYYGGPYPKAGMKLAREIGTMTYRSGPEWDERFGRKRINETEPIKLCPSFMIENYLEYQGESFSVKYDPNSLLYLSKTMDLFDVAEGYSSIEESLARVTCPAMVLGVSTDVLFPVKGQRKLAAALKRAGNNSVTYYELNSIYGHDTFLLDLSGVGTAVKGFLETTSPETGRAREQQEWKVKDSA